MQKQTPNVQRGGFTMKSKLKSVVTAVAFGLVVSPAAAQSADRLTIDLPLFPQTRDYAASCGSAVRLTRDQLNLQGWRGEEVAAPPDQLLDTAVLYSRGSASTAADPQLSLRILERLAERPSTVQLRSKYLAAQLILDAQGSPEQDRRAVQYLMDAANARIPGAARELAALYEIGRGVPQDFELAARYYRTAGSEGDAASAFALSRLYRDGLASAPSASAANDMAKLGLLTLLTDISLGKCSALMTVAQLYEEGDLISPNEDAAAAWYQAAADSGKPRAMAAIAERYYGGFGVEPNIDLAIEWWQRAAAFGSAQSMANIGLLYATGDGVPINQIEAQRWLTQAAENGNVSAMQYLASLFRGELQALPAEDADLVQAFYWTNLAYETDPTRVSAIMELARALINGEGTAPDPTRAFELFSEAMRYGNRSALREMATGFLGGEGVERNAARALQIFRQAAARGDLASYNGIIDMYRCGIGIEANGAAADLWLERAAAMGDIDSLLILSNRTVNELSVEEQERRLQLLLRAAANDSREAMVRLSEIYRLGMGVDADPVNADRWESLAIRPGVEQPAGQYLLAEAYRVSSAYSFDPVRVEQLLTDSHEAGFLKSTVRLGKYHIRPGDDGMEDIDYGVELLRGAASQGSADSMRELAVYYRANGNLTEAIGWLDLAIANGLDTAMALKAEWAYEGVLSGEPDPELAEGLLDQVIENGPCSMSIYGALARGLARGDAGDDRVIEALDWISSAIENFRPEPDEIASLGMAALDGAPNQEMIDYGIGLLQRSIELGSVRGHFELARIYMEGTGVEADYERALELFEQAAAQGEPSALLFLGRALAQGVSGAPDYDAAWATMERAAAAGVAEAYREMGHWFLRGLGRPENVDEGMRNLEQAARLGDVTAMLDMASIYAVGFVTEQRPDISVRWLENAANAGSKEAMHRLGLAYLLGLGVNQDETEAQRWFRLAGSSSYSVGAPVAQQ
jgi:TPR repeat protein